MSSDAPDGPARVYDRVAAVYDLYSGPMEWLGGARRRRRLLRRAQGEVVEAGVGTGLNLEHYPDDVHVTAIDVSPRMLRRARRRARRSRAAVELEVADVEHLPFEGDRFDTATATCVFCSVADPVRGLLRVDSTIAPIAGIAARRCRLPCPASVVGRLASPLVGVGGARGREFGVGWGGGLVAAWGAGVTPWSEAVRTGVDPRGGTNATCPPRRAGRCRRHRGHAARARCPGAGRRGGRTGRTCPA